MVDLHRYPKAHYKIYYWEVFCIEKIQFLFISFISPTAPICELHLSGAAIKITNFKIEYHKIRKGFKWEPLWIWYTNINGDSL